MNDINWKRLLLTTVGFGLSMAAQFIDGIKQKDDIREAVTEQLAEILSEKED